MQPSIETIAKECQTSSCNTTNCEQIEQKLNKENIYLCNTETTLQKIELIKNFSSSYKLSIVNSDQKAKLLVLDNADSCVKTIKEKIAQLHNCDITKISLSIFSSEMKEEKHLQTDYGLFVDKDQIPKLHYRILQ